MFLNLPNEEGNEEKANKKPKKTSQCPFDFKIGTK